MAHQDFTPDLATEISHLKAITTYLSADLSALQKTYNAEARTIGEALVEIRQEQKRLERLLVDNYNTVKWLFGVCIALLVGVFGLGLSLFRVGQALP